MMARGEPIMKALHCALFNGNRWRRDPDHAERPQGRLHDQLRYLTKPWLCTSSNMRKSLIAGARHEHALIFYLWVQSHFTVEIKSHCNTCLSAATCTAARTTHAHTMPVVMMLAVGIGKTYNKRYLYNDKMLSNVLLTSVIVYERPTSYSSGDTKDICIKEHKDQVDDHHPVSNNVSAISN